MDHESDLNVRISCLDESGHGRGRLGERDLLVYGALASEYVTIFPPRKERRRSRPLVSSVEKILEPSHDRVKPRCVYAGACGGCLLQHMAYEKQLEWKKTKVEELFSPYFSSDTHLLPCVGATDIWSYRNKMEYTFSQDLAGKRFLGLFSLTKKRKVESIQSCEIGPPWSSEALVALFSWWEKSDLKAYNPSKDTGSLRTVTFRYSKRSREMMVILTVSGRAEWALHKKDLDSFVESLLPLEQSYGTLSCIVRIHQAIKGQPTQFYEMVLRGSYVFHETYTIQPMIEQASHDFTLQFSPQSFCQPNTQVAEKIYSRALQMLNLRREDVLWDLFCGVGCFGFAAANHVKKVVGIELSADAVFDAHCNKEVCQAANVVIERSDLFDIVHSKEHMERLSAPTLCVIDPPRSGVGDKVVFLLNSLPLRALAYVSCNPVSQKKDMALFHSLGWRIMSMQSFDQFPHTPHMENILLLQR